MAHHRTMNRRRFLVQSSAGLLGGWAVSSAWRAALAAEVKAEAAHGRVTVTDIEVHQITVDYLDWIAYELNHFYGPTQRTVYVAHASNGMIGLGEGGAEPAGVIEKYIGSSPFDWVGDETSLPLAMAMYDLMGKLADVPVYKLFGQKYRSWVPVAAWTVPTHPRLMAAAVKQFAAQGFTWMKYHLSPFENVLDQLSAMQEVAPEGFRLHFDLTMGGTTDHTPELLEKIASFPIAGCFEDPLPSNDIEGYAELRQRCRLPILLHHSPLGATFEVLRRAADGYILGHQKIGEAMRRAGLFAAAELPFSLQNVGGTITRTMTVHMQSAFKTASLHFNSDTETWKSDVVKERLEPVNGLIRVPETPGLGLTLDRGELERLKSLQLPAQEKWVIKTKFKNGTVMYNIADPQQSIFMVRPDVRRLIPMSYTSPLTTEYWDNDGSEAYKRMFSRIEREGVVLEKES